MRDKEEIYHDMVKKIYQGIVSNPVDGFENKTRQELVPMMEEANTDIYTMVKDFFSTADTMSFVRSDNHMKLKAMDLWKEQVEMFASMLKGKAQIMLETLKPLNIDIQMELKELMLIGN
jgi:hypothetical protein